MLGFTYTNDYINIFPLTNLFKYLKSKKTSQIGPIEEWWLIIPNLND